MKKVRRSVFETNSSSMHSLVVINNNEYYSEEELKNDICLSKEGIWSIWSEDDISFGRSPFDCLSTFESKVRYAIAVAGWHDTDFKFEDIENIVKEVIPICKGIELPEEDYEPGTIFYGYTDEDILSPFLKKENISLKEFLLNKRYIVIVDGDEYCIWEHIKNAGIIDRNMVMSEFYSHE